MLLSTIVFQFPARNIFAMEVDVHDGKSNIINFIELYNYGNHEQVHMACTLYCTYMNIATELTSTIVRDRIA